jgi:hypothetical protein
METPGAPGGRWRRGRAAPGSPASRAPIDAPCPPCLRHADQARRPNARASTTHRLRVEREGPPLRRPPVLAVATQLLEHELRTDPILLKPRWHVTGFPLQFHSDYLRFVSCIQSLHPPPLSQTSRRPSPCRDPHGESFMRVHWVGVPGPLRAQRLNRHTYLHGRRDPHVQLPRQRAHAAQRVVARRQQGQVLRPPDMATPRFDINEPTTARGWDSPTVPLALASVLIMHPCGQGRALRPRQPAVVLRRRGYRRH